MQIVNSTERYTNLTTNRLAAGTITANGTITAIGSLFSENNLHSNGLLLIKEGFITSRVKISGDYTISQTDSGKIMVVNNNTGAPTDISLPQSNTLVGLDTTLILRFKMGGNVNQNVTFTTSGGDTIKGTILDGAGTSVYINNNLVTANFGNIAEGDEVNFTVDSSGVYYCTGITKNAGAFT